MAGFLLAIWVTPDMTISHLADALGMTIYIFVGIHFEEKELVSAHGEAYRKYQQRTRMVLLLPKGK
jgi:protein-S-isoprenylcysteine O-methyltransferase Ste14